MRHGVVFHMQIGFNNDMTITITVQLFATFRMIAGKNKYQLTLPENSNLQDALIVFLSEVPVLKPHWMNAHGQLHAHVHVFLNKSDVSTLPQRWETLLKQGDHLDFIPPVAGG